MLMRDRVRLVLFVVIAIALITNPVFASSKNEVRLLLDEAWMIDTDSNVIGDTEHTIYQSYRFLMHNWPDNSGEKIAEIRLTFNPANATTVEDKTRRFGNCSSNEIYPNSIVCKDVLENDGAGMVFLTGNQKRIAPFSIEREVNSTYFESRGIQELTIKITPKSSFVIIPVNFYYCSPDADVKVLSTSVDNLPMGDCGVSFTINNPVEGKEYILKATLEITPTKGKVSYIPGVWAEFTESATQTTSLISKFGYITSSFGTGEATSSEDQLFRLFKRKYYATNFLQTSTPTKLTIEGITSTPATTTSAVVSLWIEKGNAFKMAGRYQEALNAYNKAIEFDSVNSNAWENKGIALSDLGRNQEAFEALVKALELNPDNLNALMHKGYALDALGRRQEAIAVAQEVINRSDRLITANSDDYQGWHYKGSGLSLLGKYNDALNAFDKAISINTNEHIWNTKGDALFALGRYQEALDSYSKSIEINPNLPHFWRGKGNALKALGRYQEANAAYDKAYELTTISSSSDAIGSGNLFLDGLKYFSVMGIVSLVIIGSILSFEKREKNKTKFREDLKTQYRSGYYLILTGQFIISAIFFFISSIIAFKELPIIFDYNKFIFAIPMLYLSVSSFIIAVGLLTSKPSTKLNKVHFFASLILGISLFAALSDPKTPVFFPFLPLISAGLSVGYDRIAIFKPVSNQESSSNEEMAVISIPTTEIKRSYAVLPNNDIKFGIRVENVTGYTITDIDTILDYNEELFNIKESKIQRIGNITPNGARTITYILKPLGCIHNEQIYALITYKDHTGKKQTLQMRPKEVHCVCPFLKEKPMSEGEYSKLAESSEFVQEGISFKGISVEDLAKFMGETCRHMLHNVREYDFEDKKVIYLSGESVGEKAYYLLTAVIQEYKGLTQVVLRAHSDKKYGLNGFMNEMADSLRHLVGSVQNAKEIGIIENTQVINIIDSVVQRTSFEMGEGGNAQVNIKESLMQRSTIGKNKP